MSAAQVLGACLIALPFVALAALIVVEDGLLTMLAIFGITAAVLGIFSLGTALLTGALA